MPGVISGVSTTLVCSAGSACREAAGSEKGKKHLSFRQSFAILLAGHAIFALAPAAMAQAPAPDSARTPAPVSAQQPAQPQGQLAAPMTQSLKVIVLQGQNSVNDTSRHIGVQPVVE